MKRINYENYKFQSDCLRKYNCRKDDKDKYRTPHIKLLLVNKGSNVITDDSIIYVGSHNMSVAAWGARESCDEVVHVFNYELGILILPKKDSKEAKEKIIEFSGLKFEDEKFGRSDTPYFSCNN